MTLLDQLIEAATEVYKDSEVMKELCIVQGVHESNLSKKPSKLATEYFNLFGIKKPGTAGVCHLQTWEVVRGNKMIVSAKFGANKSVMDSVKQHREIMELPRYAKVWEAPTLTHAARAVREAGYATDPDYSFRLLMIARELGDKLC